MTHQRIFNFPVPILIGQSTRLLGALRDATVGPGVLKRIKTDAGATFDAKLDAQIKLAGC